MRDNARTILFAAVLGIICSIMLAGANLFTAPYRLANEKAEEVRNFLAALEVPVSAEADSKTLLEIFNRDIKVLELGKLTLYEYRPEKSEKPIALAVPFSGSGLWGPVKGVLALEPDLLTIRGVRFYQQEETPGLGGEIGSDWFQEQFKGKEIVSGDGKPGFRVLKSGGTADRNSVDGITGATMTSDRVQTMMNNLARALWEERSKYVR